MLCYHRIITSELAESEGVHHSLWLTPEGLACQIKWMLDIGEIVDYSRLLDTSTPNDRPLFTLTFDDGWKDNFKYALPILKYYQVPALIFLATEAVDSGELFWPQDIATKTKRHLANGSNQQVVSVLLELLSGRTLKLDAAHMNAMQLLEYWIETLKHDNDDCRNKKISHYYSQMQINEAPLKGLIMSWNDAREMQKHGISFGSHTHNHTILEGLPVDKIESELRKSRELISDKLQIEVDCFCYPNGRYSCNEASMLSLCGYRYGFRLDNRSMRNCSDNYYIPRFLVSERKASSQEYFKLCLLEAPLYRSSPHNIMVENV